jgi:hypothetical protein
VWWGAQIDGEILVADVWGVCVEQLAELGLDDGLVDEVDEVQVGGVCAEVLLRQDVHAALQDQRVVDSFHPNLVKVKHNNASPHPIDAIPAWLAAAGDRPVHDVICNEEASLQPLDAPAEHGDVQLVRTRPRLALRRTEAVRAPAHG